MGAPPNKMNNIFAALCVALLLSAESLALLFSRNFNKLQTSLNMLKYSALVNSFLHYCDTSDFIFKRLTDSEKRSHSAKVAQMNIFALRKVAFTYQNKESGFFQFQCSWTPVRAIKLSICQFWSTL